MGISIVQSNMSPSSNLIEIYRGQSKDIQLNLTQPSTDPYGKPISIPLDLTGCSLYFTMKEHSLDPDPLILKTTADDTQILIGTPATCGNATIFLLYSDTFYLEPSSVSKKYYYDVWVQLP